ncbi:hypothetical protein U716_10455 [Rhodobacter capsulatus B6]|nr:hypothetical protein U716_10455 [Rhodobacter capsulatus B6]
MMLHPTQELEPPANPERFTVEEIDLSLSPRRRRAEGRADSMRGVATRQRVTSAGIRQDTVDRRHIKGLAFFQLTRIVRVIRIPVQLHKNILFRAGGPAEVFQFWRIWGDWPLLLSWQSDGCKADAGASPRAVVQDLPSGTHDICWASDH